MEKEAQRVKGVAPSFIVLKSDLAAFQDEQTRDAIVSEVVEEIVAFTAGPETNVLELLRCQRQRTDRPTSRYPTERIQSLAMFEGGHLDVWQHRAGK